MDLITFTLQAPSNQPDRLYGVELSAGMEVVALSPLTRVPLAPAAIVGAMNHKGHVVSLIDLAQLVAEEPSAPPRPGDPSLLVLAAGCRMALRVQKILDVHRGALSAEPEGEGNEVISGQVETAAGLVRVVNLERVVDRLSAQIALDTAHLEGVVSAVEPETRR